MGAALELPPGSSHIRPTRDRASAVGLDAFDRLPAPMTPPVSVVAPEPRIASRGRVQWFTTLLAALIAALSGWPSQRCPNCLVEGAMLAIAVDQTSDVLAPWCRCAIGEGDLWLLPPAGYPLWWW